jgi:hypothetical protein
MPIVQLNHAAPLGATPVWHGLRLSTGSRYRPNMLQDPTQLPGWGGTTRYACSVHYALCCMLAGALS